MDGILGGCFPWSWLVDSVLLKHLCPKAALMFFQNRRAFLPKELVVEILSRLPLTSVLRFRLVCKQWRLLTSTKSFIDMHENNQPTPLESSLVIQYFDRKKEVPRVQLKTFFINEKATNMNKKFKMVSEYIDFLTMNRNPKKYYIIKLLSSYKGFLVFTAISSSTCPDNNKESALIIYNPVTKEQQAVTAPPSTYVYCGFFFHSPTKEYRLLYQVLDHNDVTVRFESLALRTKLLRKIYVNERFSAKYYPDTSTPAVISNGALHWMVSETHHKKVFGRFPSCSETILSFGMETQEFRLMSHPSYDCVSLKRFDGHKMNLLEMEGGILCLCDAYFSSDLIIFMIENYEKWTWVQRLVVPVHAFPDYWSSPNINVKALQIHQGELVVYYDSSFSPEEYMLYPMNQEKEEEEPDDASYKFIKSVFFGSKNGSKILEEEFECFDDDNLILKNKKKEKSRFKVVIDRLFLKKSKYYFDENQTLRRIVIEHPKKRPKVTDYYTAGTQVALASVGNVVVLTPSLASLESKNRKPVTYEIELGPSSF